MATRPATSDEAVVQFGDACAPIPPSACEDLLRRTRSDGHDVHRGGCAGEAPRDSHPAVNVNSASVSTRHVPLDCRPWSTKRSLPTS